MKKSTTIFIQGAIQQHTTTTQQQHTTTQQYNTQQYTHNNMNDTRVYHSCHIIITTPRT